MLFNQRTAIVWVYMPVRKSNYWPEHVIPSALPLPTFRTRVVRRAPRSMGGPILRKGMHSHQMRKGCASLQWGARRAPSKPEAGEKKKEKSNLTPHALPQWLTARSIWPIRWADRQWDAGGEMVSQRQYESGASKRKKKSKQEEARASLEGGCVIEIKKKNFVA